MGIPLSRILVVAALGTIVSCVTVNIYFPAAEVRQAAEEIVRDVRGQPAESGFSEQDPAGPQSRLGLTGTAFAQQELSVSNATIRQIKERLKGRYPELDPFLKRGALGESAGGYLVARDTGGLDLRERAAVQRLLAGENGDRDALYRAVGAALNVPLSELKRVREIFSAQWQKTAPPGCWVETPPGTWVRKQ